MGKRLHFLDFLRGVAIIGVVINHAIVYGIMQNNENAMAYLPKSPLVIFTPCFLFATWAGLFSVINGIGVMFSLHGKLEEGIPLKQALKSPLINSTSLLFIHWLFQLVFTRRSAQILGTEPWYSWGTGTIINGGAQWFDWRVIYRSDALSSIAMSGYFACLVIGLLYRDPQNFANTKRALRILIEIGAVWLAISPTVWRFLYYSAFLPLLEAGGAGYIFALPLSLLACFGHGIFPYGAYTIAGLLFGLALAKKTPLRLVRSAAKKLGYILIGLGSIIIIYHLLTVRPLTLSTFFSYIVIPPDLYVVNLGLMVVLIQYLIGRFTPTSPEHAARISEKTKFLRDMGVVTLTLYCWEPVWSHAFRWLIEWGFRSLPAETDILMENFWVQIVYLGLYLGLVVILLENWKRIHYFFGMEWLANVLNRAFGKPQYPQD